MGYSARSSAACCLHRGMRIPIYGLDMEKVLGVGQKVGGTNWPSVNVTALPWPFFSIVRLKSLGLWDLIVM